MKRLLRILFVLFFLLLVLMAGTAYWIYQDLHTPVYHDKTAKFVQISRGSSPALVVKRLASEGVIKQKGGQVGLEVFRQHAP